MVEVAGAVNKPGVYTLKGDARLGDAIAAAGGVSEQGSLDDLNLAAPIPDGARVVIPRGTVRGREGERLVLRRGEAAAALNPPEFTRSGWVALYGTQRGDKPRVATHAGGNTLSGEPGDDRIDINTADATALETLPGIGPVTAEKIIDYRERQPFQSVDDLDKVSGIGPKKLEAVRELVRVE